MPDSSSVPTKSGFPTAKGAPNLVNQAVTRTASSATVENSEGLDMRFFWLVFWFLAGVASSAAQQSNLAGSSLSLNGTQPSSAFGQTVTTENVFTDSILDIRVVGAPGTPVIVLFGDYQANATPTPFNFIVDLANEGSGYANQILVNGYQLPSPATYTDPITSTLTFSGFLPSCTLSASSLACLTQPTFSKSVQAIVQDPSNAPFNIRSTGAGTFNFTNGYTPFDLSVLSGDNSLPFAFPPGFAFNFYGTTFTSCFVSANGFVSFGAQDNGFATVTVAGTLGGVRRIMSYFTDLEPQPGATPANFNPRIYAQVYTDNGLRKVRVVHERIAEFGNATGPHGGELVMSENGDINIYVHAYQTGSGFGTAIGITPGNNVDSGVGFPGQGLFGRDLSADVLQGPTFLGINRMGFELFTLFGILNPLDLAGFNFNLQNPRDSGIHFVRDTSITNPNMAQYIVLP
jgi:hypothetical protein